MNSRYSYVYSIGLLAAGALALAACDQKKPATAEAASSAPAAAAALTLPVSINAVMVSLVDHSSDPIFDVATKPPKTDDAWRDVEYHSYQMAVAGKMIQLAGTGPGDAAWVATPEWKAFSEQLSAAGMDALKLAQAKDAEGFEAVGNKIIDICEGCHTKFKPEIPTGGIFMHRRPGVDKPA